MSKSRIVERMAFSAEGLTAGLKPQNSVCSWDLLTRRGRNAHLPKVFLELSLQRSPPRLFTAAAWSGLGPAPESRSRGALPHLSRSCTTQISLRTDTLHVSLQHTLEKKSRTITGNFTHKRYDRLETKGYIKRSSQSASMHDMLYEIADAGKAALRAVGGAVD